MQFLQKQIKNNKNQKKLKLQGKQKERIIKICATILQITILIPPLTLKHSVQKKE